MATKTEHKNASYVPDTIELRDATHFRRIIAAREAIADANDQLAAAVAAAREAGDSWVIIGAALGTSKQNAQQRFGQGER